MKDWSEVAKTIIAGNTEKEALIIAVTTALEVAARKNHRSPNDRWLEYLHERLSKIEVTLEQTQLVAQGTALALDNLNKA